MGRGKNNRRRASLDGGVSAPHAANANPRCPHSRCAPGANCCAFSSSTNNANDGMYPLSLNGSPTNAQEIHDAIEFHWKNLSLDLKSFLLKNPNELSLPKFVDFWTSPVRQENTSPNIAASICGCSWYLALNYMSIGKIVAARALILNGCFLQQCYNKPIEEIASIAKLFVSGECFREKLPFYSDGLLAVSSEDRMTCFLRNKVSSDYQRRMSFATQTKQTKKKVQDYVNQISSDWNNGSVASAGQHRRNEASRRRRASLDALPADSFIDIRIVDDAQNKPGGKGQSGKRETTMRHGSSMTMKSLFKKYAEDRNLSLRQLRFSFGGRTLFLSSVGQKTPQDLGIVHLDSIAVINHAKDTTDATDAINPLPKGREEGCEGCSSSSDESRENHVLKGPNKGAAHRQCRRASWAGPEIMGSEGERIKLEHSRRLSGVFNEAAAEFESIRRKLNVLNLARTPAKVKARGKKLPVAIDSLPVAGRQHGDGAGGKAGVPFYAILVGAAGSLHATKKRPHAGGRRSASVDLHGLTREEAVADLDARLPGWIDEAMRGAYPFTVPVVIICGGGNQVLSEAVDRWIKCNENVAKAPKRRYSRRRSI